MTPLRLLSRLPLSMWLRVLGAILLLIVLVGVGLALAAFAAVFLVVAVVVYRMKVWISGRFRRRSSLPASHARQAQVTDADYTIVERR